MLEEPICTQAGSLTDKINNMYLIPDQLIYRHKVIPPAAFRLSNDPAIKIVTRRNPGKKRRWKQTSRIGMRTLSQAVPFGYLVAKRHR